MAKIMEILDKLQFFGGQRAGRELWFDKPEDVQDADIKSFNKDIATIREYIQQQERIIEQQGCVMENLARINGNINSKRDVLYSRNKQLEVENASLRSERDIAVKALISVSDKVEMVQGILDDDIFHRVEYDVYLQLRDLVDNEIMSWQHEPENSDGTQEDNNAESS